MQLASKNFAQNINKIVTTSFQQNPSTVLEFALQESKRKGTKFLSMRQFIKTDDYEGPTKNGFSFAVEMEEEIADLQEAFNNFFNQARAHI